MLMPDLDFGGHNTLYATHGLHSYAAKCPPQLARYGIETYSKAGDLVLDPMVGSGTTLVEARLLGRNAIGYDIDPLACLISYVKSHEIEDALIDKASSTVIGAVEQDLLVLRSNKPDSPISTHSIPPEFPNRDYWFDPSIQQMLALLSYHITNTSMVEEIRKFLWVGFSSLILTKVSVANARDIIHSRHHYFSHKTPPDVLAKFGQRIRSMRRQMAEFRKQLTQIPETTIEVHQCNSLKLPLEDEIIDLVFTSPPYATALDYPRAHFLAINWMQPIFGISSSDYKTLGVSYIGSERGKTESNFNIDEKLSDLCLARSVIEQLQALDSRKAFLIQRYFLDMQKALLNMCRVLKHGKYVVIVVCPSHIRKIEVPTHKVFTEIGRTIGLQLIDEHTRTIDGRKRVLPYMRESFGERMSLEYVLAFRKM
jgi:DNA modification methylase